MNNCNQAENGDLTLFKQEQGLKYHRILSCAIVKLSFVLSLGHKRPKISRKTFVRLPMNVINLFVTKRRPLQK